MSYTRAYCRLAVAFSLTLTFAVTSGACGNDGGSGNDASVTPDAGPPDARVPDASTIAPALFTPRDDLSDDQLATQALALLGEASVGGTDNCNNCHGLTRQSLFQWRALSDTALGTCLTDLTVSSQAVAKEMIDCLRQDPTDDTSPFRAPSTGIFASGAHLAWFEFTFKKAYGPTAYVTEYDNMLARIGMPRGGNTAYTQDQFDIVATWFTRGLPLVDEKLPSDPPPTECTPGVSAAVVSHVAEMALSGWRAVNAQNNLLMYGCGGAATPFECLTSYPRPDDATFSQGWEANVTGQVQRILRENGYTSAFWTRSSADGRFVANGAWSGGASSRIIDLQRDVSIPGSAFYDPGFFPDNSGFVFQRNDAYICNQSLLVSEPASINYNSEPDCTRTDLVGLYQHVGAALGGGDYWAVDGQFTSDDGGHQARFAQPSTDFSPGAEVSLTPIIHTGTTYEAQTTIRTETPFEGDAVLSTSSRMLLTRLRGPGDKQLGFVMRQVVATPNGGSYDISLPEVARYCFNGGKPAFSYNERWLVLHHYITNADAEDLGFTGSSDPGFSEYKTKGAANIYLLDTLTGDVTRISNMKPGQYALFPHFRADGWIYFLVRTLNSDNSEHIVASDAALRLEAAE